LILIENFQNVVTATAGVKGDEEAACSLMMDGMIAWG
jgi:hypothetical protein